MKSSKNPQNKRLKITLVIAFGVFILLIIRLSYLQIYKGEELKRGALNQWTRGITIKPKRGFIYDRNGKKLAVSKNASTAWVNIAELKIDSKKENAEKIARILELEEAKILEIFNKKTGHERLKQWISEDELLDLKEANVRGIEIVDDYKRYYPYESFASHVIGFTDIDNNGLYGIEKTYDNYLSGEKGKWIKITDAPGRQLPFDSEKVYEAEDGMSIVLTIDETVQKFAEKAVEESMMNNKAKNISVIAMEPKTGEILAMVNKPDYDPNHPRKAEDESIQKEWDQLDSQELQERWFDSWRNYSINDIYEPGSTFKLITAAAALEENLISKNSNFYCNGFVRVDGETLKCSRYYNPHRDLTFQQGLDVSCNIVFINTANRLGKDKFLKYLKAFGFGQKTGIDLNGEEYGLIPRSTDVIRDVNLGTMSYGHGVAVTPIQLINAVAAITNGGDLMKPRLVKEIIDSKGNSVEKFEPEIIRKVLSKETSDTMLELMESVVNNGVGSNAYIPGYTVGGKTGTAEKVIDGRYVKGKYIGSFAAVSPTNEPKMVMLVIVDDPEGVYYGGTTAAPIAKEIIENTLKYLEISAEENKDEIDGFVQVPDVTGMKIEEAGKILTEAGLRYMTDFRVSDSNVVVIQQFPESGITLELDSIIDLVLDKKGTKVEVKMPDLKGKNKEEIVNLLEKMKLEYDIQGEGVLKTQNPEPDSKITKDTKIQIKLE